MDELIQLIPVIIFIVIALVSAARRQNRQRSDPDLSLEEEEDGVFLPPWGNLDPMEEEVQPAPPVMQSEEPPPKPQETPSHDVVAPDESEIRPSDVDSAAGARVPQVDTIAGISLSSQTVRQGIILSEILGRPKSLRRPPRQ